MVPKTFGHHQNWNSYRQKISQECWAKSKDWNLSYHSLFKNRTGQLFTFQNMSTHWRNSTLQQVVRVGKTFKETEISIISESQFLPTRDTKMISGIELRNIYIYIYNCIIIKKRVSPLSIFYHCEVSLERLLVALSLLLHQQHKSTVHLLSMNTRLA